MAKKIPLKRKLPFIAFCASLAVLFFSAYLLTSKFLFPQHTHKQADAVDIENSQGIVIEDRINILVLGMDARPCEKSSRTDTIIFASFDPENNRLAVMSIPRDTRVNIPGHGFRKINEAVMYGGPELVSQVVEDLLGVSIDYYILTNFEGFKNIVDSVGGVNFYIPQNMYYYDPADGTLIDLKKGEQLLDGDKALQFIRFRGYPNGDIDRTVHQQEFFKALAKKILQPDTVTKLHNLIPCINDAIDTNLGMLKMIELVKAARNFKDIEIVSQTLPGRFAEVYGISYWYVDPKKAKESIMALFRGETIDVVQGPTIIQNGKKGEEKNESVNDSVQQAKENQSIDSSVGDSSDTNMSDNVGDMTNEGAADNTDITSNEGIDGSTSSGEIGVENTDDTATDETSWVPVPTS